MLSSLTSGPAALSIFVLAGVGLTAAAIPLRSQADPARAEPGATAADDGKMTPAERQIASARRGVENDPETAERHLRLAIALSNRARETADPEWYDRSDASLEKSLGLEPDNFPARRQQVWNQLGRHEFAAALEGAKKLNERAKDDVLTYGLLVDAHVELGNYEAAEDAAQWMLNLRPGAPAAMTRVSYLREQFGDIEGAIDAMDMAFHSTRPSNVEERAWILTHLAHLESERGNAAKAATYAENALNLFPGYHYALAELASAKSAAGALEEARELLEQRYEAAPHPENLYELALATDAAGDAEAAAPMFASFEEDALAESENVDNANLQLIEYWLDHSGDEEKVERALELASKRAETRRDIATLVALAEAQHRSGDSAKGWETISEALAVGTMNARTRLCAGRIALGAGETEAAEEQFGFAIQSAPRSESGKAALEALKSM